MRVPIIIGVVILGVVLAAGLVAPLLRSGSAKAAEEARTEAALAQRLLHRYNYRLPLLDRWAATETLKQADLEGILETAREAGAQEEPQSVRARLEQFRQQDTARLGTMAREAREAGLPEPSAAVPAVNAGGLQGALNEYELALRENAELLAQAQQHANAARAGAGGSVLGVAQIAGMVDYTRAAGLLAEAAALRQQQRELQARLLRSGSRWGAYRANADFQTGLDVTEILAKLRSDLEETRQLETEAKSAAEELAARVAQREQELAQVEEQMQQASAALHALESRGFTAGDDESFSEYRQEHQTISQRLREVQEHEELLRYGGLAGARLAGEDLLGGALEGGETVVGLEYLRPRAAAAQEKAEQLTRALGVLAAQIESIEETGRAAQAAAEHYIRLQDELDAEQKGLQPRILELAQQGAEKEDQALQAARSASGAFRSSQQAADQWVRAASDTQGEKDSERTNPRLRMMVGDEAIPQMGSSAEAAALTLMGRIYAQRIQANDSLMSDMSVFLELRPGTSFDASELEAQINTAREEAFQRLEEARQIYDRLEKRTPKQRQWIPQAGLATVHYLMTHIDPANSATYLSDALTAAQTAAEGREQSPYVKPHVQFRDYLQAQVGGAGAAPPAEEPAPEADADEPEVGPGE